jgi:hypothetical protein
VGPCQSRKREAGVAVSEETARTGSRFAKPRDREMDESWLGAGNGSPGGGLGYLAKEGTSGRGRRHPVTGVVEESV